MNLNNSYIFSVSGLDIFNPSKDSQEDILLTRTSRVLQVPESKVFLRGDLTLLFTCVFSKHLQSKFLDIGCDISSLIFKFVTKTRYFVLHMKQMISK